MTGDAPQPGETPRSKGTPWTWSDPATGAWWRGDSGPAPTTSPRARPAGGAPAAREAPKATIEVPPAAGHSGAAGEAHDQGMADTAAALTTTPVPAGRPARKKRADKTVKDVEHAHDVIGTERFNAGGTETAYAPRAKPGRPERLTHGEDPEPTIVDLLAALPVEDPRPSRPPADLTIDLPGDAVGVPEVMILPEPERNRPTVPLDRGPVPGQTPPSRPPSTRSRHDPARADRKLQDRVRAERTAELLETSPFWVPEAERAAAAEQAAASAPEKPAAPRQKRKPRDPRRPVSGLLALLALALVAAFFSWVSAEPFWLAVGHGRTGTATVAECTGSGVSQRCAGTFAPTGGTTLVKGVALLGVTADQRTGGTATPARMVSPSSRQAYVGGVGLLMHLRWTLGFLLVLLCGLGIAGLTGAGRLENARARRGAFLMSMAGPLVLLAGFLFVTY